MIYADYSYYTESFGGSLIPSSEWNHAAGMASDWMDAETFGRLADSIPEEFETQVRRCCCEMAEAVYRFYVQAVATDSGTRPKSQESIGSYSVSYTSGFTILSGLLGEDRASVENLLHAIVRKHLGRTGLLYRGVEE